MNAQLTIKDAKSTQAARLLVAEWPENFGRTHGV